jgi:hypothetical protein
MSSASPAFLGTDNVMLLSPDVSTLSPAGSAVSLASVASAAHSHDGVFLRPGAVTRLVGLSTEAYIWVEGHTCRGSR